MGEKGVPVPQKACRARDRRVSSASKRCFFLMQAQLACKTEENPLPLISYSASLQLLRRQPCSCRPEDTCQSNVKKELITVTRILTAIWWSELLRKGEHLCFLTFLSHQEKLHFWIVHDRVTISVEPVLAHSPSSSPLNMRLLLSGPLGANISQHPAQEESQITGRPVAHSLLQFLSRRSLPCHCTHCLPLPLSSTVVSTLFPAVLSQKEVRESEWPERHLLLSKPARNLRCGQGYSLRSMVMD